MKRYTVHMDETSFYYSTCTLTHWMPVFQKDVYFQIIIDSLKFCQKNKGLILHGFVIMPTHLHMITSTRVDNALQEIMRDFKHFTSTQIIKTLENENNHLNTDLFQAVANKREFDQQY